VNNEYESLRAEIKDWQDRRFTVLSGSVALVTVILGLKVVSESPLPGVWPWVSAVLLALLSSACLLTWYAGRANAKIAAYLIVFHETASPGWEARLAKLKNTRLDKLNLNRLMIVIYAGLGLLSVFLPALRHDQTRPNLLPLVVSVLMFIGSLILLGQKSPRDRYIHYWRNVKEHEGHGRRKKDLSPGPRG
jgi:hypothetical protein